MTGRLTTRRLPRDLHPGAWWLWALGLAVGASATTNPLLLVLLVAAAALVVVVRRSDQPWAGSFWLYLVLGVVIVAVRVVFRVLVGGGLDTAGTTVWLDLPAVSLPGWAAGVHLLGPVTAEAVLGGLDDGLRLAAIVALVGAANSLANPKRLLKSMPPALYEVGTAVVVSVSVLPQLSDAVRRVRAARALRGSAGGRLTRLRHTVVPVMEDALERSLTLAASMDVRGYGRRGELTSRQRRVTGALMLAGLCGICVGLYALLDETAPRVLALPMLLGGALVALAGFAAAGRRVRRSRYRPDRWRPAEVLTAASGLLAAATVIGLGQPAAHPSVTSPPVLTAPMLVAVLLAAVPALLAPPPMLAAGSEALPGVDAS
jgi:energy-coupling factor transport system permease protein